MHLTGRNTRTPLWKTLGPWRVPAPLSSTLV